MSQNKQIDEIISELKEECELSPSCFTAYPCDILCLISEVEAYKSTGLTPDSINKMIEDFEELLDCNENPDNGKYCAFYSVTGCRLKAACGACIPKWYGSMNEQQIAAEIEKYKKGDTDFD